MALLGPDSGSQSPSDASSRADEAEQSLLALVGLEDQLPHLHDLLKAQTSIDECFQLLGGPGRVSLLQHLKNVGVDRLADRQKLANAVSKLLRISPSTLRPGDANLFLTPWTWAIGEDGLAATACPGAYAKLAWRGGLARTPSMLNLTALSGEGSPMRAQSWLAGGEGSPGSPSPAGPAGDGIMEVEVVLDTSAMDKPCMTLGLSLDGGPVVRKTLPPGYSHASICLHVPLASDHTAVRTLTVYLENSIQRIDRWGDAKERRLPQNSLRLRHINLPIGACSAEPPLRRHRILAFGDSILEGIGANFGRVKVGGELACNVGSKTWATSLADMLDAEYSPVAYGRQGWTLAGNGGVPRFHCPSDPNGSAWDHLWSGCPRRFDESPDLLLVNFGTNDGLLTNEAGSPEEVVATIAAWLDVTRQAVGPLTHIIMCIPFGGFGGPSMPPYGVHAAALAGYRAKPPGSSDSRTHLIDLGPAAALHLLGFDFNDEGGFNSTPESADGMHPTVERHAQLGAMLARPILSLLASETAASANTASDNTASDNTASDNTAPVNTASQIGGTDAAASDAAASGTTASDTAASQKPSSGTPSPTCSLPASLPDSMPQSPADTSPAATSPKFPAATPPIGLLPLAPPSPL